MQIDIKRGELYLADLTPSKGSEQGGVRPVLIIQNDIGNYYSPTTIVACLTSHVSSKPFLPTHVVIKANDKLQYDSIVMLEQLRTIDKIRLKKYIGTLSQNEMNQVNIKEDYDECKRY